MKKEYIFKSERLGFRNWNETDLTEFSKLNADMKVMEHFPKPLTKNQTAKLIQRFKNHYEKNGHTYFATDILESGELIGFIGLAFQDYKTDFTPAVDIGWRLKKSSWGNGFATEGAKKCLEFAFNQLKINYVISTCTEKNYKSENIMKKIGMEKIGEFDHPELNEYPEYKKCVCYGINKNVWQQNL
ncbi:RimJ/RimL family protein N-acetyltransferase [Saonia flava]|uniref:RimJ/RimL family protein N-acetyltransferase n=1 Tax=Saonia flava TaxID=523696 RepID=A0A846R3E8_9FLAO|nr:GNAT family N-acetyltransferase [Saonia flava]NJB72913.1 RimJ/RimL family protein N-acetyltransferase [Saonia flava]